MASEVVTPRIEQCCIIKFLVKESVKPAEILHRLNTQYGEETPSHASVCDWHSKFADGCKGVQYTAVS
jgi:hypothetical protein